MSLPPTSIAPPASAHPSPEQRGQALVSVVVRSMGRPSLLAALDSIAAQDHPNIEIVLVNALGQSHRSVPDHVGRSPLRITPALPSALARAAAANAGLDAARGTLVTFLDDDDVYLDGHISKLVAALQAHPQAVAAHSDVSYGRMSEQGWIAAHDFNAEFDAVRLRFENFLPIHAVLFNRAHSAAVAACRFDDSFDLFEDWDFWLQLAAIGPFIHAPGVSARYLAGEQGGSGVFGDSPAASAARRRLFDKWQIRATPAQHAQLLEHAQAHWRLARHAQSQLTDSQAEAMGLKRMLQAREDELAQYAAQHVGLQSILAARDTEVADGRQLAADLRGILAAREGDIANAQQHINGLQDMLSARDAELAARDAELSALRALSPLAAFRQALKKKSP